MNSAHESQERSRSQSGDANRALRETGAQRFLADASTVLAATLDSRAIIETIAFLAVPSLGDLCMVHRLDASSRIERVALGHSDPAQIERARALSDRWIAAPPANSLPVAAALHRALRGGPAEIHSTLSDPAAGGHDADTAGYTSALVVPLEVRGQVLAAITLLLESESGRRYGPGDLAIAEDFARRAALAIENARLFEAEQHARRAAERAAERMARLHAVTAVLSEALTTSQVAEVLVTHGLAALKSAAARLYLTDEATARLKLVAHAGGAETGSSPIAVALDEDVPAAEAARTREPVWVETPDVYQARYGAHCADARVQDRYGSLCCVPLVTKGRTIGVLASEFTGARPFDEDERSFILTVARQCAQALDRARLYEAERRGAERLRLLANAGSRLSESLDYDATLEKIIELALPALGDFGFFDVVTGDGQVRRIARAHEDARTEGLLAGTRWVRSERTDINLCALSSGQAALHAHIDHAWLEDVATSPEHLALMVDLAFESMITVPLCIHGRTIGALTLFYGRSGRRHTEEDLQLAGELARRAAIALENARLYLAAQEAKRHAEEASRMRDEFLGVVSHELRTPLTAILGWARILANKPREPDTILRGLEIIQRNAATQVRIIEDILDVSRTITGKLRLDLRPIELEPILHAAVDVLRPTADAKNQRLTLQTTGRTICVLGDPDRMQQVVWNLLSNAIKFTPSAGNIDVRVETTDRAVTVVVSDTGRGMPRDFVPHAFDRFRQADSSSTRKHGGLGLGLAIVRHLVELHGGAVRAESEGMGLGSTFRFTLPTLPAPAADPDSAPVPSVLPPRHGVGKPVPLNGLKVLVVDDEADARELLTVILGQHGAEVTAVASATEALAQLTTFAPHVLVSDIAMPGEDGVSLIRRVRALEGEIARVPAVALTAYARDENRQRLMHAGFQMHVSKPIEPATLTAVVANLGGKVLD